jgi:lipid A 4'-phosphatase
MNVPNVEDTSNPNQRDKTDSSWKPAGLNMIIGALPVGMSAIALFWLFPDFDLSIARLLYTGQRNFAGSHSVLVSTLREGFNIVFILTCVVAAVGLAVSLGSGRHWLGLLSTKWLFLAICLLTGPGVVANLGFKDHWGRARPHNVTEFEGTKQYSSPLHPSDQCLGSCSFVSGEASAMFIIFFAAALIFETRTRSLVAVGILAGCAAGLVRMSQGAHFFSDVVFAGVLMAITAGAVQLIMDCVSSRAEPDDRQI